MWWWMVGGAAGGLVVGLVIGVVISRKVAAVSTDYFYEGSVRQVERDALREEVRELHRHLARVVAGRQLQEPEWPREAL